MMMSDIKILNPDSLGKPLGQYSQLTRVKPWELLFIAGQVGADKDGKAPADFDAQCALVFANIGAALASQGAGFANLVEFHHLSGALAGYPGIHGLPHPRISKTVRRRRLSAQHAADRRPPGAGAVFDRGERGRGVVIVGWAKSFVEAEARGHRA
jgi:enamine deaminase RidA (YjgF/YER057c/UK114 family)